MAPRTRVYVDGFNFYYGVVRGTTFKWLDIETLLRRLLPDHDIEKILYFTARVRPTPWDQKAHIRQGQYLRALETFAPVVEIVEGKYTRSFPSMHLLNPRQHEPKDKDWTFPEVFVWRNEEKGSDVSLGARMVFDGCRGAFEEAVIVSNDSDLLEPVRLVRDELGLPVHAILPANPWTKATRRKSVFEGKVTSIAVTDVSWSALRKCQLPDPVLHTDGPVHKPHEWNAKV